MLRPLTVESQQCCVTSLSSFRLAFFSTFSDHSPIFFIMETNKNYRDDDVGGKSRKEDLSEGGLILCSFNMAK